MTSSSQLFVSESLTLENTERGYLITMFAIWGIGVDLPRLLIRYGKAYSQVIDIHSISMVIVGLITIMYVFAYTILFFQSSPSPVKQGVALAEFVLAWILVVCVVVQFVLGYMTRAEMVKTQLSTSLFTVKVAHKIIGTLMSLLGKVIVALELSMFSDDLFKAWLFILAGMFMIFIVLQVIYRSQTRSIIFQYPHRNKNRHEKYHQEIYERLLKGREGDFEDFKSLGVRYLLIDNCMHYIDENFLHPGGEYIFSMYNGKQVNYLLKGTREIAAGIPRHTHSKYVRKYLENRVIGELPVDPFLINQKVSNEYVEWRIKSIRKEGMDGRFVTFQNQAGYVKQLLKVEQFGKYLMLGCPNEQLLSQVERPYTLMIAMCETQKRMVDKFKQAYNFYYTGKCQNTALLEKPELPEVLSSKLTFFIKQYKQGLFTNFMFASASASSPGRLYTMTGPYGSGLNLKSNSRGYYIMIGIGSGITPYIDLFMYLLQKTLLELIAHKVGESKARRVNSQGMNFSHLDDLKILFIGSFTSSNHFYFHSLIKDLYEINRVHRLNKFNLMLKYQNNEIESDVTMITDSFDRTFFKGLLEEENPDKVYYCGPSSVQYTMRKLESEIGLKDKFFYV